jgi:hypothetical protein
MATNRDDTFGYRRGGRGIDGNKTDDFKMPKSRCEFGEESDYGAKSVTHDLSVLVLDGQENGELGNNLRSRDWQPGGLKWGSKGIANHSPYKSSPTGYHDTHPVKANSPSGRYAKKGGKGKGFGS